MTSTVTFAGEHNRPAGDPQGEGGNPAGRTPTIVIVVHGQPAPQGSKRHIGRGVMIESSKKVTPWRQDVVAAALSTIHADDAFRTFDGPLAVRMIFTLRKPASAPKRRRTWPDRTPDLSKLARSTEDALTTAGIWADDARVVEYDRLAKVFPGEDPEALTTTGCRIEIRPITDTSDQGDQR